MTILLEAVLAGWILHATGGGRQEWINKDTGELFEGPAAPTEESLKAWRQVQLAEEEETIRFCLKQEREGAASPSGTYCTGAFSPHYLRSGKSSFEPKIQKILEDNKKFGIER